jgi:hypothetical protein
VKARIELERWQAEKDGIVSEALSAFAEEFYAIMEGQKPELVEVFTTIFE